MQAALPYLLLGGGTALNLAAESRAKNERRDILNRAMQRNDETQAKASQQVLEEGQKYSGQQRLDAMQQQEQSAIAQALSDVGGNAQTGAGAQIIDTAGGQGAVSGDFIKAKADRALSEGDRLTSVARELAKVRAPGQLVQSEGQRRAGVLEQVGSDASNARARTQAASLAAENVEAPWWGTVGKLAGTTGALLTSGALNPATLPPDPSAYKLTGARLGAQPASSFWGNTARIRF
jgi:hypothetical protein